MQVQDLHAERLPMISAWVSIWWPFGICHREHSGFSMQLPTRCEHLFQRLAENRSKRGLLERERLAGIRTLKVGRSIKTPGAGSTFTLRLPLARSVCQKGLVEAILANLFGDG